MATTSTFPVRCVHRQTGAAYTVPTSAASMAEAMAKAAAAGHIVQQPAPPALTPHAITPHAPTPPAIAEPASAGADQRRIEMLLHEVNTHLAALREGQGRLVARTHWPTAVTAVLAWAAAVAAAPLVVASAFVSPTDAAGMRMIEHWSGIYFTCVVCALVPWVLIVVAITLTEYVRRK